MVHKPSRHERKFIDYANEWDRLKFNRGFKPYRLYLLRTYLTLR